ncbi:MAG: hypothetical protein LLG04_13330 [Parachlamydia sp.]|nr:hypothetical protein [Parachlamydia sp.]
MKKSMLAIFCILVFGQMQAGHAANLKLHEVPCDPRLQKCLNKILKLPSARDLIIEIQRQGPIRITVENHALSDQFGAFWDRLNRSIGVHLSSRVSEGQLIGSIIFELHNALADSKMDQLDHQACTGQISREKYVESMEYIEYQNSKKAAAIAEEGIQKGILPPGSRLPTYKDFEEHFYYQKISGHSAWFAQAYDQQRRR